MEAGLTAHAAPSIVVPVRIVMRSLLVVAECLRFWGGAVSMHQPRAVSARAWGIGAQERDRDAWWIYI